ncbi:efflux RND transporter periplasmic adaptor subunit [Aquimarina sp. AU119]|uniref:efflux RND transporter periplasmic adaptor subunit n=1 Tax=Aquimarina sp. AU119 TaxID=2108528 RepID=UPI000D69EA81|nr:efflux RND transporter periplasmic adaptor subunit [Aquimarina sp. AU119]
MKNYLVYIIILAIGLFFGWLFFGSSSNESTVHNHDKHEKTNQMWTCAMHPQIMLPESGDCPVCGMDLIPVDTENSGLLANQFKLTENAMALANIQTSIVGHNETESNTIKLSGKIVENEEANTVQVSYFSGRIERLNINFTGDQVRKGQLLATIYSPELFAAQQELITAASLKTSQPALYKAVRNKLKLWKLSDRQINTIETSGQVKENIPVYATVSGTVSEKLVEQGDYVKQGQPLLKVANLNTVWANFDAYEKQITGLKEGQPISITTNANPNATINAKISFIDPVLNTKTRTVIVRAVLDNTALQFKPGMFIEGSISGDINMNKKQLLSIPSTAILWTGKRSVVYLKTDLNAPVFEMREVTLGNKIGDHYVIVDGLNTGDEIVTHGTFTVDAAAQLQGKKSMMSTKNSKTKEHHAVDVSNAMTKNETSLKFQEQLKKVLDEYILLKDALVKDDADIAKKASIAMIKNIEAINVKLLIDISNQNQWIQIEDQIKRATHAIINAPDIKEQRNHFIGLSIGLTNAIQTFGISQKVYSQFCPMANNNKGASWLSLDKEIRNPYFGNNMLTCGSIQQTIE